MGSGLHCKFDWSRVLVVIGLAQPSPNTSDLVPLTGCVGAFLLVVVIVLVWTFETKSQV